MNQLLFIILFILGLSLLAFFFLKKKAGTKSAIFAVACIILVGAAYFLVQNFLISYSSPEEAFLSNPAYRNLSPEVISGDETALVFGMDHGKLNFVIVEKASQRWKIGNTFSTKMNNYSLTDGCFATVYHKAGTQDYYIMVSIRSDEEHEICDNVGSSFIETTAFEGAKNYITHFSGNREDYRVSIDGKDYPLILND
ncbi:MAG: hypothetical protein IJK63_02670 [Oscillospiraceae bacterium]|nr:hypothetical protein [Oscillospiraceae bacterium]